MTDKKVKALNALGKLLLKMSDYDLNMLICYGEGMMVKANGIEKRWKLLKSGAKQRERCKVSEKSV